MRGSEAVPDAIPDAVRAVTGPLKPGPVIQRYILCIFPQKETHFLTCPHLKADNIGNLISSPARR